jgi:hypothetical protein
MRRNEVACPDRARGKPREKRIYRGDTLKETMPQEVLTTDKIRVQLI